MALVFDNENEVVCPKCNSRLFTERQIYGLDKRGTEFDPKYVMIQPRHQILCADCGKVIVTTPQSVVKEY